MKREARPVNWRYGWPELRNSEKERIMRVIVGGRCEGKTTAIVEWLLEGQKITYWPFWSRIAVCSSLNEADYIRSKLQGKAPDHYRMVFSLNEYIRAPIPSYVEIAVDNVDMLISTILKRTPEVITVTGQAEIVCNPAMTQHCGKG